MAVELSAKYGFVAPDDLTFEYLAGREFSPKGQAWDDGVRHWRSLGSDAGAVFDREVAIDCTSLRPQITWGTSPQHVTSVNERVPDPGDIADSSVREAMERALIYMDIHSGMALSSISIDAAYIGSCTNARLSDLRGAAQILKGRKVAQGVRAICVPGSTSVKRAAEAEGIDRIFIDAGFEWHESGCGICGGMSNPHFVGKRVVSTTNRNFENRQGRGAKTHLANPSTVAASAILGRIADPGHFVG